MKIYLEEIGADNRIINIEKYAVEKNLAYEIYHGEEETYYIVFKVPMFIINNNGINIDKKYLVFEHYIRGSFEDYENIMFVHQVDEVTQAVSYAELCYTKEGIGLTANDVINISLAFLK